MKRLFARILVFLLILAAGACSDPDSNNANNGNNGADVGPDATGDTDEGDADADGDELTVASVQPASGPMTGGTDVVISGTGFD
jgi:hypothetical protein